LDIFLFLSISKSVRFAAVGFFSHDSVLDIVHGRKFAVGFSSAAFVGMDLFHGRLDMLAVKGAIIEQAGAVDRGWRSWRPARMKPWLISTRCMSLRPKWGYRNMMVQSDSRSREYLRGCRYNRALPFRGWLAFQRRFLSPSLVKGRVSRIYQAGVQGNTHRLRWRTHLSGHWRQRFGGMIQSITLVREERLFLGNRRTVGMGPESDCQGAIMGHFVKREVCAYTGIHNTHRARRRG